MTLPSKRLNPSALKQGRQNISPRVRTHVVGTTLVGVWVRVSGSGTGNVRISGTVRVRVSVRVRVNEVTGKS